ncbi:MAG: PAS domain S-box protein, partial [Gloeobacteraceae cyanobacterium ES-bin-144]|nr:PAS domain S-box protein [Verrucomicrobiales bacterium]
MKPPIPSNEGLRLATLAGYRILDTPPEPAFDEITELAAAICGTPIAMVSLVDESRQWFKAKVGTDVSETTRLIAFCAHTICQPDMLLVSDALKDGRFVDNPLVTGELGVRFYAGVPLIASEGLVMGAICVLDRLPRELDETQKLALRVLGRRVVDQMELRKQIQRQKMLEAERSSAFLISEDLLSISDLEGRMVEVNPAWTRCLGWSTEELTGKRWLDFVLPEDQEATLQIFARLRSGEPIKYFENRYRCKDGTYRWLSWSSHQLVEARQFFSVARDVSEHKREEIALTRSNRAWRLFSRCNEALIHAVTEKDLVDAVCRIIVDEGKFGLAWVGYAMDDKGKTTVPQAHAGLDSALLPEISLTWADAEPLCLTSRVIQSGEPVIIPDLEAGMDHRPWKSFERKHGLCGVVGLPLKEQDRTFGVLMLYQHDTLPLPEDELRLLRELADNLAFGIVNLRANEELRKTHDAVLAMSCGVYNSFSGEFYEKLVFSVVETLGAHAGCIAKFNYGQAKATTICALIGGELVENFEYSLDGTPCEHLLKDDICYVPEDVAIHYPRDIMLVEGNYQAYAGAKLYDVAGQAVGLLFLLFRQPISQRAFISSTLRLFAARASDELERIKYEKQFLRAQRMESIGTLAGGIAHDINNVLTPIMMSIDLLRMYVDDPDGINILDMVGASASRGADMVRQVLSFARGDEIKAKEMEIAPIINDLLRILQDTFPKNIRIESELQSDIWQIKADATQIHQVLLNFCVNARDAMP